MAVTKWKVKKIEILCFISVTYESGNVPCVFHQLLCNKNDFFFKLRVTFPQIAKEPSIPEGGEEGGRGEEENQREEEREIPN